MARVRRNWTPEEDALLRRAVKNAESQSRPLLWRELAKSVPGRSNKDCRRRWWNSLAEGMIKGPWSEEEDERLIAAVRKYGTDWRQVSRDVWSRNADQCSSHWSQVLDPGINYCDWTFEEDAALLREVLAHSTNWATIAGSHKPNRTTLALKNRYSTLRLKHDNRKKPSENIAKKIPGPTRTNSNAAMTTTRGDSNSSMGPPKSSRRDAGNRADQLDDEDDGDDGDDDEGDDRDEEIENEDMVHEHNKVSCVEVRPNSSEASNDAIGIQTPYSNLPAWESWAERNSIPSPNSTNCRTPTVPTDNRTIGTANHIPYNTSLELNHSSQYPKPREDYFCGMQDAGGMSTSLPYATYDTSPIDIDLSTPPGFCTSSQPAMTLPTMSTLTGVETNPIQDATEVHTSISMNPTASSTTSRSSSTSPSATTYEFTTYQVSISMVCTRAQLDAVMVGLAGLGTYVTLKVDAKQ